jgi:exonuclease III
MIPGFHVYSHELLGNISSINHARDNIFNPYSHENNMNLVGDRIANEEENNAIWHELSDFLLRCTYTLPIHATLANPNELSVLSLNIRSLQKGLPSITDNLDHFSKYDVLCFNETNCDFSKLPNGIDDLMIEGFHPPVLQAPSRKTCRGGGLITYVNVRVCDHESIEKLDVVSESNLDGEFLFVKILKCKRSNKTILLGNVYRSPSRRPTQFNDLLVNICRNLERHHTKHILLLGDFNIDLIKHDKDINSQDLLETTSNHGFIQVISKPTRVTDHSATLIDHIYSNKVNNVVSSSVVTLDISDHLACQVTISLDQSHDCSSRYTPPHLDQEVQEFRMVNEANHARFKHLIDEETWVIPEGLEAEAQYEFLLDTYTSLYNTAYPLRTNRVRRKNERVKPSPWILPWLEDACNRKNLLHKAFIEIPSTSNKVKYLKMKKFTDKHCKLAKNKYHNRYFEQYKDNSKKQWQMINKLLNRGKKKVSISKLQDSSGEIVSTPSAIAQKFNLYFSNIASNLKNSRSTRHSADPESYLTTPSVAQTIYLNPVSSAEVLGIIKNLKNKATLDSKVSAVKIASENQNFNSTLARVISASFSQGVFPQSLKLARVIPVYKNGSRSEVSNYRPISLLKTFSKIYEKLMHKRIVSFMNSNESFYEMQFGFRAGRSCEHALLKAQSILLDSMNKNQVALLLFIDFSKAFDMVEYPILFKKLEHYGIRGTALAWIKSYLENRSQFVSVNGTDSTTTPLVYGVPQGSILGPLLFVIYINDMPGISDLARFILYADDANIILTGSSIHDLEDQLHVLTKKLSEWVTSNGLMLNLRKTNYMIFSRRRINHTINLSIDGTEICRTTEARFLGVLVDDKLRWSKHIKTVKAKMARYIGIMYKIKNLLPQKARLQLYHSFVQSHVNFCSLIWGFSAKSNIESLFSSQKKGLRAVMPGFVNYFYKDGVLPSHTKASFNSYKILTIQNLIAKNAILFMHKVRSFGNLLPPSVKETIASNAPEWGGSHESSADWLKSFSTVSFENSLFYKGPLIYIDPSNREIFQATTSLMSIEPFKANVKKFILKVQSAGDSEVWQPHNFPLYNIHGLRRSARLRNLE